MSAKPAPPAVELRGLSFAYAGGDRPVFEGLSLAIARGARCLLLGANGVGKSTLLRLVAGRHMIPPGVARVHGRDAFRDTGLATEVAFLGGPFPFDQDIAVGEMLARRLGVDGARRARVLEILDVDPAWRMHRVSDGQRRRVQILLDLERAPTLVLLDEVTADLDVLARAQLLALLREESESRGVTVIYASHVLDGLEAWATDLLFLSPGRVRRFGPLGRVLAEEGGPLARLCERWMTEDRARRP